MMVGTGRHWQRAWRYIRANQTAPARATLESILAASPGDVRARVFLGAVSASEGRPRAAAEQVRLAAATACTDPEILTQLANLAIKVGEVVAARDVLRRPGLVDCSDPARLLDVALAWQLLGDNPAALTAVQDAGRVGASSGAFHFYLGTQLGFAGRLRAAERELARCTDLDPPMGHAFLQLAHLRRQTPARNHVPAIRHAISRVERGGDDHVALQFALYRELEDLHRYPEAWDALVLGNSLARARSSFDAQREGEALACLRSTCTPEFLANPNAETGNGPTPIFVIGMPRSGTTLLERILGNHSRVESAGEFPAFLGALSFAIDHFAPVACPDGTTLARIAGADWPLVARHYLAQSQWRASGKARYVDKLPRNWMLAGLLHKAFPRAPILNLVRDPVDACFSNWRAHLGMGSDFSYAYDLGAIVDHYRHYRQMMVHWHRAMPRVILDVSYARLVHDPDAVAREVFAFCGLDYEAGCTAIEHNPSPTATLSMAEVRNPIHARAFREWAPYADHLAGLRAALADIEKETEP